MAGAAAAVAEQPEDEEDDRRSDDGEDPCLEAPEAGESDVEDDGADPAAEKCSDDPEDQGGDLPSTMFAGHDHLGDRTANETQNKECHKAHDLSPFPLFLLVRGGCHDLLPLSAVCTAYTRACQDRPAAGRRGT